MPVGAWLTLAGFGRFAILLIFQVLFIFILAMAVQDEIIHAVNDVQAGPAMAETASIHSHDDTGRFTARLAVGTPVGAAPSSASPSHRR